MKYIDSEKLIAEIERRRLSNRYIDTDDYEDELFEIITALQQEQPEVDFDREITHIWGKCAAEPKDQIACLHIESFIEIARHFYELGLNARKED